MTPHGPFGLGRRSLRRFSWGALPALAFAVLLLAEPAPIAASGAGWSAPGGTGVSWTNGVTLCQFSPGAPSVNVSALGLSASGLSMNVSSVQEVNASTDLPVAVAIMSDANWTVTNASTSDTYELVYTAEVPIVAASSSSAPLGATEVSVDFLLPAYAEEDAGASELRSVSVELGLTNWTWQAAGDSLVITLSLWPTYPANEELQAASSSASEVVSVATATGATREFLSMAATANVSAPQGGNRTVGVVGTLRTGASFATAALTVLASGYRSLAYSAVLGLPTPVSVAGIPLYDFALAGATALIATVLVGLSARRLRARPSDLVYVEEPP